MTKIKTSRHSLVSKDSLFTRSGRVQLLFRLWSLIYDNPVFQRPIYGQVHNQLLKKINPLAPDTIMDAGCGTGELLLKLAARRTEALLVGLDLSLEMLQVARKKNYGRTFVHLTQQSVYRLPFKNESFDLITNSLSSHWYKEIGLAMAEFVRVLKPGGRLIMASMTNYGMYHFPGPWQNQLKTLHSTFLSPTHQKKVLESAGFQVDSMEPIFPWPTWLFVARKPD